MLTIDEYHDTVEYNFHRKNWSFAAFQVSPYMPPQLPHHRAPLQEGAGYLLHLSPTPLWSQPWVRWHSCLWSRPQDDGPTAARNHCHASWEWGNRVDTFLLAGEGRELQSTVVIRWEEHYQLCTTDSCAPHDPLKSGETSPRTCVHWYNMYMATINPPSPTHPHLPPTSTHTHSHLSHPLTRSWGLPPSQSASAAHGLHWLPTSRESAW